MKMTFTIFVFLLSFSVQASYVAQVKYLKGRATLLRAGTLTATEVKVGQRLKEDASVLTYAKSILKIKFFDEFYFY